MDKIIAGSLNIDASDDWMKFMPNCFKCLRASGDDLSVVEIIKLCIKGVDKVNEQNTIAKSRAEQSRAEQSRAEQSRGWAIFMVWMAAIMLVMFMIRMDYVLRCLVCKVEGGSRI